MYAAVFETLYISYWERKVHLLCLQYILTLPRCSLALIEERRLLSSFINFYKARYVVSYNKEKRWGLQWVLIRQQFPHISPTADDRASYFSTMVSSFVIGHKMKTFSFLNLLFNSSKEQKRGKRVTV